jgi:hypothetical protein
MGWIAFPQSYFLWDIENSPQDMRTPLNIVGSILGYLFTHKNISEVRERIRQTSVSIGPRPCGHGNRRGKEA